MSVYVLIDTAPHGVALLGAQSREYSLTEMDHMDVDLLALGPERKERDDSLGSVLNFTPSLRSILTFIRKFTSGYCSFSLPDGVGLGLDVIPIGEHHYLFLVIDLPIIYVVGNVDYL